MTGLVGIGVLQGPRNPVDSPGSSERDFSRFDGLAEGSRATSTVASKQRPVPKRNEEYREHRTHVCAVRVHDGRGSESA